MSAATVQASESRANLAEMVNGGVRNLLDEQPNYGYGIVHVFGEDYTVATTNIDDANDILRLIQFPPGAYIWSLRVTATDMDTHATPTLVFDIVTTDSSDVVKGTLIDDTTIGQGAGTAVLADASIGDFVGNYWLAMKVATGAATAAAGTLKVVLSFSIGILNVGGSRTVSALNPLVTDATL